MSLLLQFTIYFTLWRINASLLYEAYDEPKKSLSTISTGSLSWLSYHISWQNNSITAQLILPNSSEPSIRFESKSNEAGEKMNNRMPYTLLGNRFRVKETYFYYSPLILPTITIGSFHEFFRSLRFPLWQEYWIECLTTKSCFRVSDLTFA